MLAAAKALLAGDMRCGSGAAAGGDLELPVPTPISRSSSCRFGAHGTRFPSRGCGRHLRRHGTDILHVHKGRAHGVGLIAAIGMGHRPRLVVNRGVTFPLDFFNRWKYRHPRVASVVCVADAVREVVIRSGGLRPDRVHTIHGGTDPGVFDPGRADGQTVRHELGIDPDTSWSVRYRCGTGRDGPISWRPLPSCRPIPTARLLLVGCEPETERTKVEEAAREAGLPAAS